ncbi:MAG: immunity 53 family protein [Phycisphaerales bacterium]|nr:immunity 53 family protein [Phycisphaerales bacterium]
MNTSLHRLSKWYTAQCNGEWEHDWGITIQTIDNPGWMIEVNLEGTPLRSETFSHRKTHRSPTDWFECATQDHGRAGGDREGRVFVGAGGPGNLEEIITMFCDWAEGFTGKPRPPKPAHPRSSGPRRR